MKDDPSSAVQPETRRLAAIMFTDIVGFSRQMGSNEARTLRLLEAHNRVIEHALAAHHGHVIKTFGDAFLAHTLSRVGRAEEASGIAEQALRRKPFLKDGHLTNVGIAYDLAGRPEEAIAPLKQVLTHYPNSLSTHLTLAAVYSELGREAEARAEAAEVLRLNPQFSLEVHKQRVPIKDPETLERHLTALRKAGLK